MNYPLKEIEIRTYGSERWGWKAQFGDGKTFPIVFSADSEAAVIEKAENFRADAVQKHENTYLARKQAAEKARQAKSKKDRMQSQ